MGFLGVIIRHKVDGTLHMTQTGLIKPIFNFFWINGTHKTNHDTTHKNLHTYKDDNGWQDIYKFKYKYIIGYMNTHTWKGCHLVTYNTVHLSHNF